jgi:hypothetical protein
MAQFKICAIQFHTTVIPGVGTLNVNEDGGVVSPDTDGSPINPAAFKLAVSHGISFSTHQIAAMMALILATGEIAGAKISGFATGIKVFLQQSDSLGPLSTSSHVSITIDAGVVVPVSLSASQGEAATLDLMIMPSNATGANPIAVATNAALPTIPAIANAYTLGKVVINGSAIANVTATQVAFNFDVQREFTDGKQFPVAVYLQTKKPVATITTRNAALVDTYKGGAVALSGNGCEIFLTQLVADTTPTAAATAQHGRLTIKNGLVERTGSGGSFIADTTLQVHGRKPATGDFLNWAAAVAQ